MKYIRFKKEYRNKTYSVLVKKLKDVFISVYVSDFLFYSQFKKESVLKMFYLSNGRPTDHDKKEILPFLEVIRIEEISPKEDLFKCEVV